MIAPGRVESIWRYPVKGLPGQRLDEVAVVPGRPIPHDRRFAVAQGDAVFPGDRPGWIRRSNFLQVASNAALVTFEARHFPEDDSVEVSREGACFGAALTTPGGADELVRILGEAVGQDALRGEPLLVQAPADLPPGTEGQSFADTAPPHVSIINLASVRDLGARMGTELDPRRFRGNLYVEAEPWSEFGWVDQQIRVGEVTFLVTSRIQRCAATTINPATGERDAQVPLALRRYFDHADCGVYAIVRTEGIVKPGDDVTVQADRNP